MFNHKEEIKKSLLLSWKYKLLWVFAFFMAETGALLNFGFSEQDKNVVEAFFSTGFWQNIGNAFSNAGGFLWLLVIVGIVVIVLTLIAIVARGAILSALQRIGRGEDKFFKISLKTGFAKFLPILLLAIVFLVGNIPGLIFLILGIVINVKWLSILLSVIGWILLAVYNVLLILSKHYMYCFVVFSGQKTKTAITNGWDMFVKNWKPTLIALLVRIVSVICLGVAMLLVTIILGITFFVLSLLLTGLLGPTVFLVVMTIGIVIDVVLCFLAGMWVRAYLESYLTELFWYLDSK